MESQKVVVRSRGQFIILPNASVVELNAQQFHLLGVLRYLSGFDSDECKPSIREISALTGMHRQTIRKALVEMEEKGFLEVYRARRWKSYSSPVGSMPIPRSRSRGGVGQK